MSRGARNRTREFHPHTPPGNSFSNETGIEKSMRLQKKRPKRRSRRRNDLVLVLSFLLLLLSCGREPLFGTEYHSQPASSSSSRPLVKNGSYTRALSGMVVVVVKDFTCLIEDLDIFQHTFLSLGYYTMLSLAFRIRKYMP